MLDGRPQALPPRPRGACASSAQRGDDATGSALRDRRVTAKAVHHVWHVDLTLLPTVVGFWVPWWAFAMVQRWPFCFWLGVVLDHFSRSVVAWRIFLAQPSAAQIVALMSVAVEKAGRAPKYIVSDQGPQFRDESRVWCKRRSIRPRFGAVGKSGSIAVIERFFRSLKHEMLRRLVLVPLAASRMRAEIAAYVT